MAATVPTAIKNLLVFLLDSPSLELLIICTSIESNRFYPVIEPEKIII